VRQDGRAPLENALHYHSEIIIPPIPETPVAAPPSVIDATEGRAVAATEMAPKGALEAAIESIMRPCWKHNEGPENDEGVELDRRPHAFWDWYVIGGRWAGTKLLEALDPEKLEAFRARLVAENITVHGMQAGKQELSPASQIPKVDAMWRETFPELRIERCPLFAHAADQYAKGLDGVMPMDICRLVELPKDFTASQVIFAQPAENSKTKDYQGPPKARWMIADWMNTGWDGKVASAIEMYIQSLARLREEWRKRVTPTEEWLAVTVDCHG
jgi:hypothetical protein